MLRRMVEYFRRNVVGFLALFVALGGSAYAVNTVNSTDIVDGQVKSVDIGDGEVNSADVKDQSLTTFDVSTFLGADIVDGTLTGDDVADGSLTGFDIKDGQIGQVDLADGTVNSAKVADNSLTGTDINESTLNMPPTTTGTFASSGGVNLNADASLTKVASKNLPAGSWAVSATVTFALNTANAGIRSVDCELHNGSGFIGGTGDRRSVTNFQLLRRSLSMNGGAQVPAGGGEVSLWCSSQGDYVEGSQMMMIRLDGFS
jgi:hypothetical protein